MTAWASEFFFFRKSMVSRRSSSSVSYDRSRKGVPVGMGSSIHQAVGRALEPQGGG